MHPRSPASARKANSAVPPFRKEAEATENTPGQRIPTVSPQKAQAMRDSIGEGDRDAST